MSKTAWSGTFAPGLQMTLRNDSVATVRASRVDLWVERSKHGCLEFLQVLRRIRPVRN